MASRSDSFFGLAHRRPPVGPLLSQPALGTPGHEHSGITGQMQMVRAYALALEKKSQQLDRYLTAVEGKCPVHFAASGKLVTHDTKTTFQTCHMKSGDTFPFDDGYRRFKRNFVFEPYTYCYYCGSPQDHGHTYTASNCHSDFYSRGLCPWAHFTFVVVFSIWHDEGLKKEMVEELKGLGETTTYDQFVRWCLSENLEQGEYTKMLEAFL